MTDARVTQVSTEEWLDANPAAQTTQVAAEVWGAISAATVAALVSQVTIEQWAPVVPDVVPGLGMQTAVSVNTG